MRIVRRALTTLSATTVAAAGVLFAQVMRAAHRSDLPSFPNQDPSGSFGDPSLPPLRVVALGDSSITAPGVDDLDNTWVRRVARSLALTHHIELISLAVGGSKARDVIEGQLAEAIRLEPDVAIVSVGANDAIRSPSTDRYRRDLTSIVEELEAVCDAIIVLGVGDLGSIPRLPALLRPVLTHRSRAFDAVATSVAAASTTAIKVWTRGRISQAFWDDHSLFAEDLFHPGDTGHGVFAEEALPAFRAAVRVANS